MRGQSIPRQCAWQSRSDARKRAQGCGVAFLAFFCSLAFPFKQAEQETSFSKTVHFGSGCALGFNPQAILPVITL